MKRHEQRNKRNLRKRSILASVLVGVLMTVACAGNVPAQTPPASLTAEGEERVDTGFVVTGPESYDSADTAVLVEKDTKENKLTFLNLVLGKRYTLSYDGTTKLLDKHDEAISLSQVAKGDIVDIRFLKSEKHLVRLNLSPRAWKYDDVERYEIDPVRREVTIGQEIYRISENTQYLSAGKNIDLIDLNASDILSFQGIDKEILSISVERGHGYLRLINDENFIDGWIEVGQTQVQKITPDMLMTVPEGSYQVNISHKGNGGTKSVVINRNEETVLDIGDLLVAEAQVGTVLFSLTPASANLYIDGTKMDSSLPISLEYGIHQLIVRAEGYQTLTRYLRVGQESAGIDVVLEKADPNDKDSENASENDSVSGNDGSIDTVTGYYKVYVDAPEKAEVYLDGTYVGISPCSWKKQSGTHVITLRKSGFETRSYTVQVDTEDKDTVYSFVDLIKNSSNE